MNNKMNLEKEIANELASANEDKGGTKNIDKLTTEEKREIRERVRRNFKEDDSSFSIDDARRLHDIVLATSIKIKEGEDISDPVKKAIYDTNKNEINFLDQEYERMKVQMETKTRCISAIKKEFADNWGICDSFEHFANKKFADYIKKYKEQIQRDSVEDFKESFGVSLDMDPKEFYNTIITKYKGMSSEEKMEANEVFKYIVYMRFALLYNKQVDGGWKMENIPALYNLEEAIQELPEGHFLTNDELLLITSKGYSGGSNDGYAWYEAGERRINFSPDCIANGSIFGNLANPMEFRSTLFHEIGHAVSNKFGRTSKYNYKKFVVEAGWTYQSKELRAGMTATGSQQSIPRTGSNGQVELITEYASKAPEEAFAEYYSFYCVNKKDIDNFLMTHDKKFLQTSSRMSAKSEDETRTMRQIMRAHVLPLEDDLYKRYLEENNRLSERGHDISFELTSPWDTTIESFEKTRYNPAYIRNNKNAKNQQQTILTYRDGKKRVVFHGYNDVELARMNKKLCSTLEIPKEMYLHLKKKGFSNIDITNCLVTEFQHHTPKKQIEPQELKHGLMYRDHFIDQSLLYSNHNIFAAMKAIYDDPKLQKAIADVFGGRENDIEKSVEELYLEGVISDEEFAKSRTWKYLYTTYDKHGHKRYIYKQPSTSDKNIKDVIDLKEKRVQSLKDENSKSWSIRLEQELDIKSRYLYEINNIEQTNKEEQIYKICLFLGLKNEDEVCELFGDGKILKLEVSDINELGSFNISVLTDDCFCKRSFNTKFKYVLMDTMSLDPDLEKSSGIGTSIFYNQVSKLRSLGFKELRTSAVRSDVYNGYYTWARLGYKKDGEMKDFDALDYVNKSEYRKLPEKIKHANSLGYLLSFKEGQDFWREYGTSFEGVFYLSEDSISMNILNNYMNDKENE